MGLPRGVDISQGFAGNGVVVPNIFVPVGDGVQFVLTEFDALMISEDVNAQLLQVYAVPYPALTPLFANGFYLATDGFVAGAGAGYMQASGQWQGELVCNPEISIAIACGEPLGTSSDIILHLQGYYQ